MSTYHNLLIRLGEDKEMLNFTPERLARMESIANEALSMIGSLAPSPNTQLLSLTFNRLAKVDFQRILDEFKRNGGDSVQEDFKTYVLELYESINKSANG